tara:strand:+ start:5877 stop:6077 length:201 start_codon:yes stop_codon:yes gene_type:complete
MSSNYPDNIREFDHDSRSPFYTEGPECSDCGEEMVVEQDADEDGYYTTTHCLNIECSQCADYEGGA